MADLRELDYGMLAAAEELVEIARQAGWNPRITSVKRSTKKQRKYYAAYLRGEMPYTVAKPGSSTHEAGIAFDMTVAPHKRGDPTMDARLAELGKIWERVGGTWGGRFRDPIHFDARKVYGWKESRG